MRLMTKSARSTHEDLGNQTAATGHLGAPAPLGRLYHAASSYYSMIARLALAETGIGCEMVPVDIHARMAQFAPDYVRLNRNMTVPTLVLPDRVIDESRNILEWAFETIGLGVDAESAHWLDRHYAFPIDQLTFGWLLSWNPVMRWMVPRRLAAAHRRLEDLAIAHPTLAAAYAGRAAVFGERIEIFDPAKILALARTRRAQAIDLLDDLEQVLADGRAVLAPPRYGCADVVFTAYLARIHFVGLGGEVRKRSALARYYGAMRSRRSFASADIWTRLQPLRMIEGMLRSRKAHPA
jgi:tetrachloro-p-hydroquinone reductive dehalogenase